MVEFYVHIKHDVYEQKITHNGKCKSEEIKLIIHHDHSYENKYLKTYMYKSNLGTSLAIRCLRLHVLHVQSLVRELDPTAATKDATRCN